MNRARALLGMALALVGCGPAFDTSGPRITEGPVASVVRDTTATIVWQTSERANSLVEYGETTEYGTVELDNHFLETHVITIKNLQPETTYHLRAVSYDLFGNGPTRSRDVTIVTLEVQPPPDIVISEVMPSPVSATVGEFIELYNNGLDDVDLTGFTFTDGDSTDTLQAFGASTTVLNAGEFAVIVDADYIADTYPIPGDTVLMTTADTTIGNALSLDDPISLFAPGQSLPASTYGTPADAFDSVPLSPGTGVSVERIDSNDADAPGNWCLSIDPGQSTPGQTNSGCT